MAAPIAAFAASLGGPIVWAVVVIAVALFILYNMNDDIVPIDNDGQETPKTFGTFVNWVASGAPGALGNGCSWNGIPCWVLVAAVAALLIFKGRK